jgi:hypothetical protein
MMAQSGLQGLVDRGHAEFALVVSWWSLPILTPEAAGGIVLVCH